MIITALTGNVFVISRQAELTRDASVTPSTDVAQVRRSGTSVVSRVLAVVATLALYWLYRVLRVGAGRSVFERGLPVEPFRHALTVIEVEHAFWLDIEQGLQDIFLGHDWVIRFANGYYSWAHQVMTLGLVVAVLLKAPWHDARRWVGALLLQLPVALLMFRVFPLMPPRLLDSGAPWGGRILQTHRGLRPTGIVDTLVVYRGPWSPGPVPLSAFTNQYAAMPSLHCGFALWVAIVCWQWGRGTAWRFVGPSHAAMILLCVVVTGNHYVLDAVAGWALAVGLLAVTGRFGWLKRFLGEVRLARVLRPTPEGAASGQPRQGASNRMPSTTSTSQ